MARKVDPERAAREARAAALLAAEAHQAWARRDEAWRWLRTKGGLPEVWLDELDVLADKYLEAGVQTEKDARALDGQFASMTKPPVLPFYTSREYAWDERPFWSNSTYRIIVEREEMADRVAPYASVLIREKGNAGGLSGTLSATPWPVFAILREISAKGHVAARLVDVWRCLLHGYGVDTWRIEPYEAKRRFWRPLIVRGDIEMVAEGTRTAVVRSGGSVCR